MTDNKWVERDFFKAKLGKFCYFNEEKEKEKQQLAQENEKELMQLLKKGGIVGKNLEQSEDEKLELLRHAFDYSAHKQVMQDYQLDVAKLPLGMLQIEKVKKCNQILNEISRLVVKQGAGQVEREKKIEDLTTDFYQALPFDFGVKRPTLIDHLQRVKEKSKLLEAVADICVTEKCFLNAMDEMNQNNPAITFEKQMLTKISHVSSDDEIFALINESVKNTNDTAVSVTVRHVFQLDKPA